MHYAAFAMAKWYTPPRNVWCKMALGEVGMSLQ